MKRLRVFRTAIDRAFGRGMLDRQRLDVACPGVDNRRLDSLPSCAHHDRRCGFLQGIFSFGSAIRDSAIRCERIAMSQKV